ncbi:CLUMA_CG016903, isoform A [Clunio marinus]|uniref:CLUMA_CG016903, isoform A n=1 Tax=Clunio marinus TaxID=568069 RepID=A0A1J1ITT2_9DIPT|nr:CLUMA_CG016903, isoform A [Clunio marinus]
MDIFSKHSRGECRDALKQMGLGTEIRCHTGKYERILSCFEDGISNRDLTLNASLTRKHFIRTKALLGCHNIV